MSTLLFQETQMLLSHQNFWKTVSAQNIQKLICISLQCHCVKDWFALSSQQLYNYTGVYDQMCNISAGCEKVYHKNNSFTKSKKKQVQQPDLLLISFYYFFSFFHYFCRFGYTP